MQENWKNNCGNFTNIYHEVAYACSALKFGKQGIPVTTTIIHM